MIQIGAFQAETCTCGKRRYQTRAEARRAARSHRKPHWDDRLRAYECVPGIWHLGYLPLAVIDGQLTRDEYNDGIVIAAEYGKCMLCFTPIEPGHKIYPNYIYPYHTECPHPL